MEYKLGNMSICTAGKQMFNRMISVLEKTIKPVT